MRFKTNPGAFQNKYKLNFWVYVGITGWEGTSAKVPDIYVRIGGDKGACNLVRIHESSPDAFEPMCQYCTGGRGVAGLSSSCSEALHTQQVPFCQCSTDSHCLAFHPAADFFWRWTHYLPWHAGSDRSKIYNSPSSFQGCGGNGVGDLDYVEFVAPYNWGGDRWVCIDGVQLA